MASSRPRAGFRVSKKPYYGAENGKSEGDTMKFLINLVWAVLGFLVILGGIWAFSGLVSGS